MTLKAKGIRVYESADQGFTGLKHVVQRWLPRQLVFRDQTSKGIIQRCHAFAWHFDYGVERTRVESGRSVRRNSRIIQVDLVPYFKGRG